MCVIRTQFGSLSHITLISTAFSECAQLAVDYTMFLEVKYYVPGL